MAKIFLVMALLIISLCNSGFAVAEDDDCSRPWGNRLHKPDNNPIEGGDCRNLGNQISIFQWNITVLKNILKASCPGRAPYVTALLNSYEQMSIKARNVMLVNNCDGTKPGAQATQQQAYGPACYRPGGCADVLIGIAATIDACRFNPGFPKVFPRFVQHAIWRYCAQPCFDVCNGNQIDDRGRCTNMWCRLYSRCDRLVLHAEPKKPEKAAVLSST